MTAQDEAVEAMEAVARALLLAQGYRPEHIDATALCVAEGGARAAIAAMQPYLAPPGSITREQHEAAVAEARADEREQAAQVCEAEKLDAATTGHPGTNAYNLACAHCAVAIRATEMGDGAANG